MLLLVLASRHCCMQEAPIGRAALLLQQLLLLTLLAANWARFKPSPVLMYSHQSL